MYSARFVSDNGDFFDFGIKGNNVFDMNVGEGVSVNIGTSQGFLQVGETVENGTIGGRNIDVKGVIYKNIESTKRKLSSVFAPFSAGTLTFNEKYTARVYVKESPTFSPQKGNGRFTMLLYSPFPYFYKKEKKVVEVGTIVPMFSFPVNYSAPHYFGVRGDDKSKNIINDGDVSVPFSLRIESNNKSTNIVLTNMKNYSFLKLNGQISNGEVIEIYRDEKNVLKAELTSGEEKKSIISWIDEKSDLFELVVGSNPLLVSDDEGGNDLVVKISYNTAVVVVYED